MGDDALLESANRHFQLRNFKEAKRLYIKVEKQLKQNDRRLIDVYRGLAESNQLLDEFDAAIEAAEQYKKVATINGREDEIQRSLVTIGTAYLDKANGQSCRYSERDEIAQKARDYLKQSIAKIPGSLCEKSKKEMKARSLLNLYYLETTIGNHEKSVQVYTECEMVAKSANLNSDLFNLQYAHLRYNLEKEDFNAAESSFKKCKATLQQLSLGEKDDTFYNFNADLTMEHIRMQARAEEHFTKADNIFRNHKTSPSRRSTESKIVLVHKHVSKLKNKFNEMEITASPERLAALYEDIADLYDHSIIGFKRLALKYYIKAEKTFPLDNVEKRANLLYTIGALYEDMKCWQEASTWYSKEIEMAKEYNLKSAEDSALGVLRCSIRQKEEISVISNHLKNAYEYATDEDSKDELFTHMEKGDSLDVSSLLEFLEKYKPKSNDELILSSDPEDELEDEALSRIHDSAPKVKNINSKGETQLHALVKDDGNLEAIKALVDSCPSIVNISDKLGFIPLHDACIGGKSDYVRVLVDRKANVNFQNKHNITPLMDSCYVGCLDSIRILLQHNANVNFRDKNGWSAGDYLEKYISVNEKPVGISEEDREFLSKLRGVLKEMRSKETRFPPGERKKRGNIAVDNDDCDSDSDEFFVDDLSVAKMPRRPSRKSFHRSTSDKAEDSPEEGSRVKSSKLSRRPKTRPIMEANPAKPSRKRLDIEEDFDSIPDLDDDEDPSPQIKKRKIAIANDDDHEVIANAPEPSSLPSSKSETPTEESPDKKAFTPCSATGSFEELDKSLSSLCVVVDIDGHLLRVVIDRTLTVRELADECARRYFDIFGRTPKLTLSTDVDQALLYPTDQISAILCSLQGSSRLIKGHVDAWLVPPFEEAYERFCRQFEELQFDDVRANLAKANLEGVLSLDNCGLGQPSALRPVIKAMRFQECIRELTITACNLGRNAELFKAFCQSIATLPYLSQLDVSNNGLRQAHVQELFEKGSKLDHLNVSHNFLTDSSGAILAKFASSLRSLSVSSCYLTKNCFENDLWSMAKMQRLNVSNNRLGEVGIGLLLKKHLRDSDAIQSIDLSHVTQRVTPQILADLQEFGSQKEGQLEEIIFRRNKATRDAFSAALVPFIKV